MQTRAVSFFVGFVFLCSSILFLGSGVTGAAVGSSFANIFGILLFLCSLLFFLAAAQQPLNLEAVLNDTISQRHKKNLAYYGGQLLHHYPGRKIDQSLPTHGRNPLHYEVGKVNLLMRHLNGISESDRAKVSRRYSLHELVEGIEGQEIIVADAKELNTLSGGRGRGTYRYVFDRKSRKYLGIAKHTKKGGYEWVD